MSGAAHVVAGLVWQLVGPGCHACATGAVTTMKDRNVPRDAGGSSRLRPGGLFFFWFSPGICKLTPAVRHPNLHKMAVPTYTAPLPQRRVLGNACSAGYI